MYLPQFWLISGVKQKNLNMISQNITIDGMIKEVGTKHPCQWIRLWCGQRTVYIGSTVCGKVLSQTSDSKYYTVDCPEGGIQCKDVKI